LRKPVIVEAQRKMKMMSGFGRGRRRFSSKPTPAIQACRRMGLPADYLYVDDEALDAQALNAG
jgi:hypothetical protein